MKKIIFLILVLFSCKTYSQNAEQLISDLKGELKQNPDAKRTATIYSDLTWYYSNISIDSALNYGKKAIESSIILRDSTLLSQVYSDVGAVYFRNSEYEKSKNNYLKAYSIRKHIKDIAGLNKINANLANIYLNTKEYNNAMKYFLASLKYFEEKNDLNNSNVIKSNIGQLFTNLRDYPNALKYLNQSINYFIKTNQKDRLCEHYLNLARVYEHMNMLDKSEFFYKKSIENCKLVANKKALAMDYQFLAIINSKKNKDSISNSNIKLSQALQKQVNSNIDNANLKLTIVRNLIKKKSYIQSKEILTEIKKIFEDQKSNEDLLYTYKYLIPVCAHINQPDSVSFYTEKYTILNEKIITNETVKQTTELEAKYQTAKKEKLLLEKEIEIKNARNRLLAVSFFTLFIGLLAFLIYRQQKLKNKQQEQEFQLKTAIVQIETQNKLHEQRLSISRDLHDNIGAQLTFVISSIDNLNFGNKITDNKITNQLTRISDFTKSTIIELRDTIWAMNTNEFTYEDLQSRILNFIEKAKFAKETISFKFNINKELIDVKFSSIIGINVYRTIQEAVNNAIKYAEAKEITVNIASENNQIKIIIEDNGKGFDLENIAFGNGIYNMEKRIEEIDGIFTIQSKINHGTTITILLNKTQNT